jgi:hypothetical protein
VTGVNAMVVQGARHFFFERWNPASSNQYYGVLLKTHTLTIPLLWIRHVGASKFVQKRGIKVQLKAHAVRAAF